MIFRIDNDINSIYKKIYNSIFESNRFNFNNKILDTNLLLVVESILILFLGGYSMLIKKYGDNTNNNVEYIPYAEICIICSISITILLKAFNFTELLTNNKLLLLLFIFIAASVGLSTYMTKNTNIIHKTINNYNYSNMIYYIISLVCGVLLCILYVYELIENKLDISLRLLLLFMVCSLVLLEYNINKNTTYTKKIELNDNSSKDITSKIYFRFNTFILGIIILLLTLGLKTLSSIIAIPIAVILMINSYILDNTYLLYGKPLAL